MSEEEGKTSIKDIVLSFLGPIVIKKEKERAEIRERLESLIKE